MKRLAIQFDLLIFAVVPRHTSSFKRRSTARSQTGWKEPASSKYNE